MKEKGEERSYRHISEAGPPSSSPPLPNHAGQCTDGFTLLSTSLSKLSLQFILFTVLVGLLKTNPELSGSSTTLKLCSCPGDLMLPSQAVTLS